MDLPVALGASELLAAREQMAFTLGSTGMPGTCTTG